MVGIRSDEVRPDDSTYVMEETRACVTQWSWTRNETRKQRKEIHGMSTACFFTFLLLLNMEGIFFLLFCRVKSSVYVEQSRVK